MGLFTRGPQQNAFDAWRNVPEPRYSYHRGKLSAYVFFIDDHVDKDKILAQRLYAIDNTKTMFKILLEKEIYDKTPEYYSEPALFAQLDFYRGVNKDVLYRLLIGAMIIGIGSLTFMGFLHMNSLVASLIALALSLGYMFIFMNHGFNKVLSKRRKIFRDTLISLFTEERLEEMLDIQDAYTERRNKELAEMRKGVAKLDDVPDRPNEEELAKAKPADEEETAEETTEPVEAEVVDDKKAE